MKEEEEKRIAQMTHMEFVKMTSAVSREAESWTDATLEDVGAMDQMASGQMVPKRSLDSSVNPHSIPYTAKGEFERKKIPVRTKESLKHFLFPFPWIF